MNENNIQIKIPYVLTKNKNEEWRVIQGFTSYMVSNCGRVYSIKRHIFLKPYKQPYEGYYRVKLKSDTGEYKEMKVGRLVAMAFIPNPEQKKYCHHININSTDNRQQNLQWVTLDEHTRIHREVKRNEQAKVKQH